MTEIVAPAVTVASHGNALPTAILIGANGILPPSHAIDDDHLTSYDPAHDGIDFWESLEGMRVTIDTPQAVSNTNEFGETDVVASHGVGATGVNDRGGITISPNADGTVDYNPEKIQIDDDSAIFAGFNPGYTIGDQLSSVTGIVNYSFDNYEVVVTEAVSVTKDVTLEKEATTLEGDANNLSIATYNLENLDTSDNKFDILAGNIVYNLARAGHHRGAGDPGRRRRGIGIGPVGHGHRPGADRRDLRPVRAALCLYRDRADRPPIRPAASRTAISATATSTMSTACPMSRAAPS